jgi:hypothetical protein
MLVPLNCTSILQSRDQGIIRSFKHYYHNQLVSKTISMIDHKLLHDATFMKLNLLNAQHFTVGSWCCHMYNSSETAFRNSDSV